MITIDKRTTLLSELRRQTNGAVVEAMSSRGVGYPLSYGVAVTEIRRQAGRYAPDHPFAVQLYPEEIRELRLAACYIADPAQVRVQDAPFWAAGITCGEVAEHVALMLGCSPVAESLTIYLLEQDSVLQKYAGLLCGARAALDDGVARWEFGRIIPLVEIASQTDACMLNRGITVLLSRLWVRAEYSRRLIDLLIGKFRDSRADLWQELRALNGF